MIDFLSEKIYEPLYVKIRWLTFIPSSASSIRPNSPNLRSRMKSTACSGRIQPLIPQLEDMFENSSADRKIRTPLSSGNLNGISLLTIESRLCLRRHRFLRSVKSRRGWWCQSPLSTVIWRAAWGGGWTILGASLTGLLALKKFPNSKEHQNFRQFCSPVSIKVGNTLWRGTSPGSIGTLIRSTNDFQRSMIPDRGEGEASIMRK
jgi:hypothetical protein